MRTCLQVFVAGSTGRLGLRIVRQLLLEGFNVRAGARNTKKAEEYVELAISLGILTTESAKRLKIVSVDLEDKQTIVPAIGNAGMVRSKFIQCLLGRTIGTILDFIAWTADWGGVCLSTMMENYVTEGSASNWRC